MTLQSDRCIHRKIYFLIDYDGVSVTHNFRPNHLQERYKISGTICQKSDLKQCCSQPPLKGGLGGAGPPLLSPAEGRPPLSFLKGLCLTAAEGGRKRSKRGAGPPLSSPPHASGGEVLQGHPAPAVTGQTGFGGGTDLNFASIPSAAFVVAPP